MPNAYGPPQFSEYADVEYEIGGRPFIPGFTLINYCTGMCLPAFHPGELIGAAGGGLVLHTAAGINMVSRPMADC